LIKRKFGWTNVDVPIIGQGTWLIDDDDNDNRAIKTLKIGLDHGMTHIDTAEMYGNGKAEELVGQAIAGRNRKDIF
jgi:aryl-alcohol dehydrogenase-like predicted oxidoreductase